MINPDLDPWNIFNDSNNPRLGVSGNVIVSGKEWYNAYMPCFFELQDVEIVTRLKKEIDDHNSNPRLIVDSDAYREYLSLINNYFSEEKYKQIVSSLKSRVNNYFNCIESKLFLSNIGFDNEISLLGFVLAGLNLMQEYMDPVETLTTLKTSTVLKLLDSELKSVSNLEIVDRFPSSEVAYIPMVVLINGGYKGESLNDVFNYYQELFEIDKDTLLESAEYSNNLYDYSKYMSLSTAKKINDSTAKKINSLKVVKREEEIMYHFQQLNGIMTWSKYILLGKSNKWRRYDSTNNILQELKKMDFIRNDDDLNQLLVPKTVSGSEKQGLLIFLLKKISLENKEMYLQIKEKAVDYFNYSKL